MSLLRNARGALARCTLRPVGEPTPRRAWTVWGVTWLSYATYYFGRKNLSVTKAAIGRSLGSHALYGVETAYLAAYAVGQYGSGWLGDRVGARKLVGVGMLVAAAASFAFGLWSAGALFLATAVVNGFAQSTGWPGNVKAMQEWTTPESRGRVMGVWATCYQVGGIAATAFAASMLARGGWRAAYYGPAAVIAVVGVVVLVLVPARGPAGPSDRADPDAARRYGDEDRQARRAVALSATVWWYGASYFFIKLIRYSLLFWLPFYLETALGYGSAQAGYFSTSFEIGGVLGTMALGALSDRLPAVPRSLVCAASLVGLGGRSLRVHARRGPQPRAQLRRHGARRGPPLRTRLAPLGRRGAGPRRTEGGGARDWDDQRPRFGGRRLAGVHHARGQPQQRVERRLLRAPRVGGRGRAPAHADVSTRGAARGRSLNPVRGLRQDELVTRRGGRDEDRRVGARPGRPEHRRGQVEDEPPRHRVLGADRDRRAAAAGPLRAHGVGAERHVGPGEPAPDALRSRPLRRATRR